MTVLFDPGVGELLISSARLVRLGLSDPTPTRGLVRVEAYDTVDVMDTDARGLRRPVMVASADEEEGDGGVVVVEIKVEGISSHSCLATVLMVKKNGQRVASICKEVRASAKCHTDQSIGHFIV